MTTPLKVGIMGCGNIAAAYLKNASLFRPIKIEAVADLNPAAAEARAKEFGVRAVTPDALLADPQIDIVLNLTVPKAHYEVARRALEAGKHIFSEKPYVLNVREGKALAALASEKCLKIGSAPDTILGGSHQYGRKLIDQGEVGRITSGVCALMGHGHESWHPNPAFFYQVGGGPLFDMGPYYISNLVQLIGPVARVTGFTSIATPTRTITSEPLKGTIIPVETPTNIHGVLEFVSGAVVTVLMSFDVWHNEIGRMVLHGTEGSIYIPDPNGFSGDVRVAKPRQEVAVAEQWQHPLVGANFRSVGLADMAAGILENRPPRCNGEFALHVVDIMDGLLRSGAEKRVIEMTTTCERFEPLTPEAARALMVDAS